MRIAIFGTGGVGGYFGGKLAQVGEEVTFIARGEHLKAIQQNGLRVDSISGDFVVKPAKATDNPAEIGAADAVLLCTKAWSVPEAIEQMKPLMAKNAFVIWLGNGIEPTDQLEKAFGRAHVLGGLTHISSFIAGPGHIQHVGIQPHIAIGELDHVHSARVENLLQVFARIPEIKADVPDDIHLAMWEKFAFIAATSGVGAVTRQPIGIYRSMPETRAMLAAVIEEVVKIGRARGIAFDENAASNLVTKEIDLKPAGVIASMQRAIMDGKPSELEAQTGTVIRMGRELGIPTPANDFIYAALLPMELKVRGKI
ncbi:MAG: 2-dehydropantoate 2-reductase [Chloroflexi bacterium]|nr:2-dehydropantoate 2-reductase [Chloroflexota bacterium]